LPLKYLSFCRISVRLSGVNKCTGSHVYNPIGFKCGEFTFGFEYEIVREYPHFFLDYQEHFDASVRWTDRIISTSGEWSGNLYDFFYKTYNKLIQNPNIKIPFKIENGRDRVDDTPVHKTIREALVNSLFNADFNGARGLVVKNNLN